MKRGCQAFLAVCLDAQSAADASCAAVNGDDVAYLARMISLS